jgi:regulator of ribonuclease activity A
MDFHVKALGTTPRKSTKAGAGQRDIPLKVGEIEFLPGHFLYSDPDGVVVLPEPLEYR